MAALMPAITHAFQAKDTKTTSHKPNPVLYLFLLADVNTVSLPGVLWGMDGIMFIKGYQSLTENKCSENMKRPHHHVQFRHIAWERLVSVPVGLRWGPGRLPLRRPFYLRVFILWISGQSFLTIDSQNPVDLALPHWPQQLLFMVYGIARWMLVFLTRLYVPTVQSYICLSHHHILSGQQSTWRIVDDQYIFVGRINKWRALSLRCIYIYVGPFCALR